MVKTPAYFTPPTGLAHVYKSHDPAQQRRLMRLGWKRAPYDWLRVRFDARAMHLLSAAPDGEHYYWRQAHEFSLEGNPV